MQRRRGRPGPARRNPQQPGGQLLDRVARRGHRPRALLGPGDHHLISNRWTVAAATLYLASRIVHALAGVTILRSSAFYAGWLANVTIAAVVL